MLNCQVGVLPMTYLGIPVSDSHIGIKWFRKVVEKMGN